MAKQIYKLRAFIASFTEPNKKYTIKRKLDGKFTCNCPSWIFNHSGDRTCKHTRAILESGDNIEVLFMHADKFVLDVNGEKWTIIKDLDVNGNKIDPVTGEVIKNGK